MFLIILMKDLGFVLRFYLYPANAMRDEQVAESVLGRERIVSKRLRYLNLK